jgi:hypothetical protein
MTKETKQQLTQEHIEKLFKFVQSKNVPYRDVQFEIVDHLASAIEDMQVDNPEWSFGLCLDQVYGKFPITGFAQLIEQKEEALNKYWKKKLWPYLFEYFKLPRIIITVTLFLCIQQFFQQFPDVPLGAKFLINPNLLLVWVGLFILIISSYFLKKRYKDVNSLLYLKSFHLAGHVVTSALTVFPIYFYCIIYNPDGVLMFSGIHSYVLAWFVVGIIIKLHTFHFVFPKLLHEEAHNKYAHLKMKLA